MRVAGVVVLVALLGDLVGCGSNKVEAPTATIESSDDDDATDGAFQVFAGRIGSDDEVPATAEAAIYSKAMREDL